MNDAVWLVVCLRSRDASAVVMSTVSVPLFSRVPQSPLTLALPPPNGALNDAEAPVRMLLSSVAFVSVVPHAHLELVGRPGQDLPGLRVRLVELALRRPTLMKWGKLRPARLVLARGAWVPCVTHVTVAI